MIRKRLLSINHDSKTLNNHGNVVMDGLVCQEKQELGFTNFNFGKVMMRICPIDGLRYCQRLKVRLGEKTDISGHHLHSKGTKIHVI